MKRFLSFVCAMVMVVSAMSVSVNADTAGRYSSMLSITNNTAKCVSGVSLNNDPYKVQILQNLQKFIMFWWWDTTDEFIHTYTVQRPVYTAYAYNLTSGCTYRIESIYRIYTDKTNYDVVTLYSKEVKC